MLHALFENGHIRPHDLETHIKDEIEREGAKIAEMTRRVKQAYTEVVSIMIKSNAQTCLELTICRQQPP